MAGGQSIMRWLFLEQQDAGARTMDASRFNESDIDLEAMDADVPSWRHRSCPSRTCRTVVRADAGAARQGRGGREDGGIGRSQGSVLEDR